MTVLRQVQTITDEFKAFQAEWLFWKHAYLTRVLLLAQVTIVTDGLITLGLQKLKEIQVIIKRPKWEC